LRYATFPRMIAADGGLPIVVDGRIIGAIGVSGAAGPDDARVAQAGIDALK
jgi:glc operon protein GlcG